MKQIKRSICVLCSMFCLLCCVACAKEQTSETNTQTAQVDMQALQDVMLAADTTLPEMKVVTSEDEQAELNFSACSTFSYDRVASYFYAYAADGGPQEIIVVELKDGTDAAVLMNTFQEHLKERQGVLESYAPDQLAFIERAVIKQKGNCVTMIICEKSGLVQKAFEER
ncbi:MAG: DUF4358 domain-containing protein [Eubacterium sp.]|nr:DUF4358 domain-containing protein [Eubacterium sp.]